MFSEGEEKIFSNSKQKALRRAFDLKKGLTSKHPEILNSVSKSKNLNDSIRALGRRENQIITSGKGVHTRINAKAEAFGSQATQIRNPKIASQQINDKDNIGSKITRRSKPDHSEKFLQSYYDHGYKGNNSITAKRIMKSRR